MGGCLLFFFPLLLLAFGSVFYLFFSVGCLLLVFLVAVAVAVLVLSDAKCYFYSLPTIFFSSSRPPPPLSPLSSPSLCVCLCVFISLFIFWGCHSLFFFLLSKLPMINCGVFLFGNYRPVFFFFFLVTALFATKLHSYGSCRSYRSY